MLVYRASSTVGVLGVRTATALLSQQSISMCLVGDTDSSVRGVLHCPLILSRWGIGNIWVPKEHYYIVYTLCHPLISP